MLMRSLGRMRTDSSAFYKTPAGGFVMKRKGRKRIGSAAAICLFCAAAVFCIGRAAGCMEALSEDKQDAYWAVAEEILKDYVAEHCTVRMEWHDGPQNLKKADWQGKETELYECYFADADGKELPFWVWVEKTENGYAVQTDFKQSLFRWTVLSSFYEYMGEEIYRKYPPVIEVPTVQDWKMHGNMKAKTAWGKKLLLWAVLPATDGNNANPYYGCLGEDVILCSQYKVQEWEPVFQIAYEKMYAYQKTINGDLSQNIRFCDVYDLRADLRSGGLAYDTWREEYELSGGEEYPITFDTEYGAQQRALLERMHEDLRLRQEQAAETENGREAEYDLYTVKRGDSLWKIAQDYYGDAQLYHQIYEDNRDIIGGDKNYLLPDSVLRLYWQE